MAGSPCERATNDHQAAGSEPRLRRDGNWKQAASARVTRSRRHASVCAMAEATRAEHLPADRLEHDQLRDLARDRARRSLLAVSTSRISSHWIGIFSKAMTALTGKPNLRATSSSRRRARFCTTPLGASSSCVCLAALSGSAPLVRSVQGASSGCSSRVPRSPSYDACGYACSSTQT